MDEREEGLGMSDLGDAPSEPGLSPSVEPVPVSPPDGASIPIAEARPRSLTPEMAFRAALKTVADLVAEGLIEDDEAGHAADIAKYGRRGMDGYELAQTLDRSCMWNCDLQMAECLDAFSSYARDEIEAAEKAWAERNSIAAPLPIGAPVKLLRTGELGKIDEVYKHGAAKYCVAIGGEPSNTRRIVNFEDVAAQGIEAERPRPEGARGEAREPGPKDAPKPPSEPLS